MKQGRTILSVTELSCGQFDAQHVHSFEERFQAKNYVKQYVTEQAAAAGLDVPGTVTAREFMQDLWSRKEGSVTVDLGTRRFIIGFLYEDPSYAVSDGEVVTVLEAFTNYGRTRSDYDRVAVQITEHMHRYCQKELLKFIKSIIRAFASASLH